MVSKAKFGQEGFVFNGIEEQDYQSGCGSEAAGMGGKQRRGGVGGRGTKSNNHHEAKRANQRRNEKFAREDAKVEAQQKSAWIAEENKKWAPVDKKDQRHQKKQQQKNDKITTKAAKAAAKAADDSDD